MNRQSKRTVRVYLGSTILVALLFLVVQFISSFKSDYVELTEGDLQRRFCGHGCDVEFYVNSKGEIMTEPVRLRSSNPRTNTLITSLGIDDYLWQTSWVNTSPADYRHPLLHKDGRIYLTGPKISIAEFQSTLITIGTKWGTDVPVAILADQNLPHSRLVPILDAFARARLCQLNFATKTGNSTINFLDAGTYIPSKKRRIDQ